MTDKPKQARKQKSACPSSSNSRRHGSPSIIVDQRHKDSSLQMSMYFSPTETDVQLKIKPLVPRLPDYFDQIVNMLRKSVGDGEEDCYAVQIADAAERIHQKQWLDDWSIVSYISFLCSQTEGKIALLDSGLLPEGQFSGTFCEQLRFEKNRQRFSARLRDADYIICPIHHGNHWSMMILSKVACTDTQIGYAMYCWDSLNQIQTHPVFFNSGERLLRALHHDKTVKLKPGKSYRVPAQHNFDDCGVAACYFIERFFHLFKAREWSEIREGCFLNAYQQYTGIACDYSQFRKQILKIFHTWHCTRRTQSQPIIQQGLYFQFGQATIKQEDKQEKLIDLTTTTSSSVDEVTVRSTAQTSLSCRS